MLYLQTTNIILKNISKNDLQEGVIDFLFKNARNSEETDVYPYIQIPKCDTKVKINSFSNCYD
jgi:sortase (surface protein transpeptidase)